MITELCLLYNVYKNAINTWIYFDRFVKFVNSKSCKEYNVACSLYKELIFSNIKPNDIVGMSQPG